MIKDTGSELARVARFLGIDPDPSRLQRAVELSSADRMRKLEKLEQDQWIATKDRRKDIPFIGIAKAGGWKTSMPESCVWQIESAWGELMTKVGYELVTQNALHRTR